MCGHSGRKCPCVTERFTPVESVQCSQVEPYHGCWHMKTATFWWGGGPEALIWRPPPRFQSHHRDLAASGLDCRNKPQRRTASTYKYRQGWAGAGPNRNIDPRCKSPLTIDAKHAPRRNRVGGSRADPHARSNLLLQRPDCRNKQHETANTYTQTITIDAKHAPRRNRVGGSRSEQLIYIAMGGRPHELRRNQRRTAFI